MGSKFELHRQQVVDELDPDELSGHPVFDDISTAIAAVADTEHGFVALMEDDQQCIVGQLDNLIGEKLDRTVSFCTHTLAAGEITIVEDALEDERFRDNPLIKQDGGIRFYVGIPVIVDEIVIGTVCATGPKPGAIGPHRRAELFGLVRHVEPTTCNALCIHRESPRLRPPRLYCPSTSSGSSMLPITDSSRSVTVTRPTTSPFSRISAIS